MNELNFHTSTETAGCIYVFAELFHEYQITVITNKSPSIHHWDFTKAYLWMSRRAQTGIRSLLLAPTRELATQIHEEATKFAKASGYASACVPCSYKIGMLLVGLWLNGWVMTCNYIYANLVTSWFFKQAFRGRNSLLLFGTKWEGVIGFCESNGDETRRALFLLLFLKCHTLLVYQHDSPWR